MKTLLIAAALLVPNLALAYPNPNIALSLSSGEMVNSIWTQPYVAPTVLADTTSDEASK